MTVRGCLRRTASVPWAARLRAVGVLLLGVCAPAAAHTLSESISSWQVRGDLIQVQFLIPDLEAKRLTATGKDMPSAETAIAYLRDHLGASTAGQPCPLTRGPVPLRSAPGFTRYELQFSCPGAKDLQIHSSAFYELVPSHTDFARIQDAQGSFHEELLTTEHREAAITIAMESPLQKAGILQFIRMGVMHIFTGVDHMSFMLGLVLISRRVRDLLFVVTGFTIGHSCTLALAVTGIIRPDARYIDSLVALTIALIGAENVGDLTRRPLPFALGLGGLLCMMALAESLGTPITLPMSLLLGGGLFSASYLLLTGQMGDAGRVRLLVTLVFGLIHGFGFASNLLEMRLPADRLAPLLFGFNVGVEIGQLTVVLGTLALVRLCLRLGLSMPRPLLTDLAASFLIGEGLYWFLGRSVNLA